ncbi:MAG: phosphoesterase [Marmoricola sp.]|nr:phosphoesterase [Marmoricola sp.]
MPGRDKGRDRGTDHGRDRARTQRLVALACLLPLLLLAGCGFSRAVSERAISAPSSHAGGGAPAVAPRARVVAPISKVLVVIEENHSLAQMRERMPFLTHLSNAYGYATDWRALTHPSEPNYLAIVGGSTFGVNDDDPPAQNAPLVGHAPSVFDQALHAHKTADTYVQSMPLRCDTAPLQANRIYAAPTNPWVYFEAGRKACLEHDQGLPGFTAAARADTLPNVGFLIPNLAHDAHDGTLRQADAWLRQQLGPVLASQDFRTGRLIIVVTADEDNRHSGNRVLTSVLSPRLHHKVVRTLLDHYSLTRFIDRIIGQPPLAHAATAPDLRRAFGL